ncbi:MAG: SDR family oxidoreductase [Candidatus Dormibacteraeota bacterium]|nr:SDR family oxidoreductase [Candidatus Dormibacteraeota bacterium]
MGLGVCARYPELELKGTVALVTGGATGIGRAICLDLARAGVKAVVVNYSSSKQEAESTARELTELGAEGIPLAADVASEAQVLDLVAQTVERQGRLDVVVNNAGTTRFIPFPDLDAVTEEVWDHILGINLKGPFYVSRAAAPHLRRTKGCIVNIASIAALRGSGSSLPYGVSKAALTQLTRALAVALAPDVRVNSVNPGLVATRWFRRGFGDEAAQAQEEKVAQSTPLQAVAAPEHVAQAVMGFIRSDMVTGQHLVVDGGKNITY